MSKLLKFALLCLLVLSFALGGVAQAQEPQIGTAADNACNTGGAMARQCDNLWAWTCGWYLARFTSGQFSRAQVLDTCQKLLPPLPVPAEATTTRFCFRETFFDFSVVLPPFYNNLTEYASADGSCSGAPVAYETVVIAPDAATAFALCTILEPLTVSPFDFSAVIPFAWVCT